MDRHGFQKNSIRSKINHELWKVRLDFSSSFGPSIDGVGLSAVAEANHLQPVTGGVRWSNEEMVNTDIGTVIGDIMNVPIMMHRIQS